MNIAYHEVKPCAALQPFVDCYWLVNFDSAPGEISPTQNCLPFGMVEVIVQLDDNRCDIYLDEQWKPLPKIFLAGMYQEPVLWRAVGSSRKFGIRLKPETLSLLFKTPASIVFSDFAVLHNIAGKEADYLVEQLSEVKGMQALIERAEAFLLAQIRRHQQENSYVIAAAKLIRSAKGNISIDEVSKSVYVSPRQLQRSFRSSLGTSPKTYMRIIRFRNAYLQMQHLEKHGGWTGLSYDLGYADQAHLIKEFKEFTGIVPSMLSHTQEYLYGRYTKA